MNRLAELQPPPVQGMLPVPHRVRWRRQETPDVVTLALEPAHGDPAGFEPGQFNMLWAFGVGEAAISVRKDPSEDALLHTVRAVGEITHVLCGLRAGDELGVRGPFGCGWGIEQAAGSDLILVAGGVGLAPLMPAVWAAAARRASYRRIRVLIGARSPDELLFGDELARLGDGVEVETTVDRAAPGWTGNVGFVTDLVQRATLDPAAAAAMICGPEIMMRLVARHLVERGVAPERIGVAMERNMKCAIGFCGHCQLGPEFVCRDGPVFPYDRIGPLMAVREL